MSMRWAACLIAPGLAIIALSGVVEGTASATAGPLIAPGGLLDPAFTDADIYLDRPATAMVPDTRGCRLAARYVDLINAGKYHDVAALYADDASFLEPARPSLQGRAQIDAFYVSRIGRMAPQIIAVGYFGDDGRCLVELALEMQIAGETRYGLVSADHFVLNKEGRISSMIAFARPSRGNPPSGHAGLDGSANHPPGERPGH